MYEVKEIEWEDIKPIWETYLWPEKKNGVVTETGLFTYYRSRGLWVNPEHRKKGLAKSILIQCLEYARNNGGNWVWTVPRQSALKSYKNAGFVKKSDWFDDGQFGPNCIASKYL